MSLARHAGPAVLLLLLAGTAGADVLVSADGDRLNGKLVEQRDGVLVFDSELLGRIEVPAGRARIEAGAVPPAVTPAVTPAVPPAVPPAPQWSSDIGVRLAVDRGSLETPEENLRLSMKNQRPTQHGVIRTDVDYRRKREDDVLKDDDWDIAIDYQRFVGADYFIAGRAIMIRELKSDGYEKSNAALVSAGWRLWEADHQHVRIGPALGYLDITRSQGRFGSPALGLYATTEGPAWGKLRFGGELVMLDTLGEGRYAKLELRLRQPLGERLFLALVWDYAWSDFDIEPGVRSQWRWDLGWRLGPDADR